METEEGQAVRFDALPMDATYYMEEGYLIDCPVVTTCGRGGETGRRGGNQMMWVLKNK